MGYRPSVLIIEPQQSHRTTLEMTLSCEGMRVYSAISLDSALLQLRVLQPDLIIIGFDRQGTDESAAVAQIKVLTSAPLLVLGDCDRASQRLGVAHTLPHPFSVDQLCAKVAMLLMGTVSTRPTVNRAGGCLD